MANPFYVEPANPLQALMLGKQAYGQAQQSTGRQNALQRLQSGDVQGAFAEALGVGDVEAAKALSSYMNQKATQEHQKAALAETARYHTGQLGLQQGQLGVQQGQLGLAERTADEAAKGYDYREVDDPDTGMKRLMRIHKRTGQVEPAELPRQPVAVAPSTAQPIPSAPPGSDVKIYRKEATEARVKEETTKQGLQEGGKVVLGMVDQLEGKVFDPKDPAVAKRFQSAAGPVAGALSGMAPFTAGGYLPNPARFGYEWIRSKEDKAYLDQVKSDAQAINTVMQRNLLKGGGSITENERQQINEILGAIASSRSTDDAKALLNNFRGLVRKIFQMEDAPKAQDRVQSSPFAAPAGGIPPPPDGFVVQQ